MTDVGHFIATLDHAKELAPRLRKADVVELAAVGLEPLEALNNSVRLCNGFAFATYFDDQLAFMWGVAPATDKVGVPWLLTSTLVDKFPKLFWEETKAILPIMRQQFPVLTNIVHADHATSIRYLRRLGFHLNEAEPFGPKGEMFHRFSMGVS